MGSLRSMGVRTLLCYWTIWWITWGHNYIITPVFVGGGGGGVSLCVSLTCPRTDSYKVEECRSASPDMQIEVEADC